MYQIKLDYKNAEVFIPKETADALGSPPEINFLYSREKSLLVLAHDLMFAVERPVKRGSPPRKDRFMDDWSPEDNGYKMKGCRIAMQHFGIHIPNIQRSGVYIFYGESVIDQGIKADRLIAFDFGKAQLDAQSVGVPAENLEKHEIVRKVFFPASWASSDILQNETR